MMGGGEGRGSSASVSLASLIQVLTERTVYLSFNAYNLMSLLLQGNYVYSVFSWNYSGGVRVPTGYSQLPT